MDNIKVIDFFSGCGGMTAGFSNAGFEVVAGFENWLPAINCYRQNFNHNVITTDLSEINTVTNLLRDLEFDMIIGGPPCQDFSHAGKRVEGKRANLTIAFAEIIKITKPKWFVMENVDRIITSKSYAKAKEIFTQENYGLTEITLDASFCGVPQKRKRFFCIGGLNSANNFLLESLLSRQTKKPMTVRDYFGSSLRINYYYRHPRNYNRRAIYSIDEPSPTIRGVNRPIPEGYKVHPNDPVSALDGIRPLTTLERAQIQTFPEKFLWAGTKTDVEQMIGNAVPVKLAEFVATSLFEYILGKEK